MIYFILNEESCTVKIGHSIDPSERIRALQTGCPETLDLWLVLPGDRGEEGMVHRLLERFHVRGEWFAFTSESAAAIADLAGRWPLTFRDLAPADFRRLAGQDSRLWSLYDEATSYWQTKGSTFCARSAWEGLEAPLRAMVGWSRSRGPEELRTAYALEVVCRAIETALPRCGSRCPCRDE